MTIATMRFLDRWVGGPLCLLLSCIFRMKNALSLERRVPQGARRILVMKYFGMGSILLSTPMFKAIREEYPGARIGFLTFSQNRELCDIVSPADEYYYIRTENIAVFLRDLFSSLREIWRKRYDMVIDMEFFSNFSMILSVLSRAHQRVGYYARRPGREILLTKPVYFNQSRHVTEVFLSLSGRDPRLCHDAPDVARSPLASPGREARRKTALLFADIGLNGRRNPPIIAINVNTSELCRERRWPGEHFIALSEKLLKGTRAILLFIGGREDMEYVEGIVSSLRMKDRSEGRVHNISGRLSLRDLIALLSRCDILITSDSGPLHLAAGTGTRTASFFGPETPSLYGPRGDGHLVFYKGLYCSPCLNVYNAKTAACHGVNHCVSDINPEEVYRAIRERFPDIWRA